jgi:signal transduction histidine kinase
MTIILILYIFYILGKAVYRKRLYSIWHVISFTVMIILFLNDLLYITNQSTSGYLSQIGVCFYIIVQSAIISSKYADSQKKVLELKDELEIVNRNLESTVQLRTKELSESNTKLNVFLRQKDFLISTLSHDLKNSFNILINFSAILADSDDLDENKKKDIANRLYETSTKGFMTLENVLSWARLQIANKSIKSEIGNLKFLIEDNLYIFSEQVKSKNLSLLVDINDNLKFLCDENHLNAILRNLISNAIKFSKTEGRIIISNESSGDNVLIKIHDEGIGIPDSLIDDIFDDNEKKRREGTSGEKGTGLGLIIVKELIDSNDGKITCKSKNNEFTEFTISFPIIKNII